MEIEDALKEFGLKDKEIKIYLTLLPLGSVNLQEIAKRIDFPRTTVYNTLNFLFQKGLVSRIIKKKVTFFEASNPKKLINTLNERKELLEKVLPDLENLRINLKESSNIEIYEGTKGLFSMLSEVYDNKEGLYIFGSYSLSVIALKHQPVHFRKIRLQKKIPAKLVIDYNEVGFHDKDVKKITEIRVLENLKDFPAMVFIYGNNVAINALKGDLVGVLIRNKEIAQAMKMVFDIYWNQGEKVKM